jgi:hypothetical protein
MWVFTPQKLANAFMVEPDEPVDEEFLMITSIVAVLNPFVTGNAVRPSFLMTEFTPNAKEAVMAALAVPHVWCIWVQPAIVKTPETVAELAGDVMVMVGDHATGAAVQLQVVPFHCVMDSIQLSSSASSMKFS